MGVSNLHLTDDMQAVAAAGRKNGMELHYGKFQLLGVRCSPDVRLPDNTCVQTQESMMYLSTMLTADGRHGNELSRRIGMAKRDFAALQKVGNIHSCTTAKKCKFTRLWSNQGSSIAWAHWF